MKMLSTLSILSVPVVAALAVACATAGSNSGSPSPSDPGTVGPSDGPSASAGAGTELPPNDIIQPVIADAATRSGVPPAEVAIVSAAAVQWPDGSLGCPQPGMMYTQALVDGYQIVVRAGGTELDYRVRGPGSFRICEKG